MSHAGVSRPLISMLESGKRAGSEILWRRIDAALSAHGALVDDKPEPASRETLRDLGSALTALRYEEDATNPRHVLGTAGLYARETVRLVREAPAALRTKTCALASEVSQYVGWLHIATGRPYNADLDRALALAYEADDADRMSHAVSFRAYGMLRAGHAAAALALTETALRDSRVSPHFAAYDHLQLAAAHVALGATTESRRALATAERRIARLTSDAPPSGYWYTPGFVATEITKLAELM